MFCSTCHYRLWNLRSRVCPECGTPFSPTDFEFAANSVQFCCPHCGQEYYGDGSRGHLTPIAFVCVSCQRHIHMNDMILRPAGGVAEEQTQPERMPWLDHSVGFFRRWIRTVGMAMGRPGQLLELTPLQAHSGSAFVFSLITNMTALFGSFSIYWIVPLVLTVGVRRWSAALLGAGLVIALELIAVALAPAFWAVVSHTLLLVTGSTRAGIARTYQSIAYSSGANLIGVLPCLGLVVGLPWWTVSAMIATRQAQRVNWGRAAFCVLTPPLLILGALVALYSLAITRSTAFARTTIANQTQTFAVPPITAALRAYAEQHQGQGPPHALLLLADGRFGLLDRRIAPLDTSPERLPIGNTTLDRFESLSGLRRMAIAQAAAESQPEGVIAHRLGEFVFTYHGMNLSSGPSALWAVVWLPAPEDAQILPVEVGMADGQNLAFPASELPSRLQTQNVIRASAGLAPLPDLYTVKPDKPAVAHTSAVSPP